MLKGISDTHAIIWYLFGDSELSINARTFFDTAITEGNQIGLSSITLAEVVYLTEKARIPVDIFRRIAALLDEVDSVLVEVPFDRQIAETMLRVDRLKVPDLPDRIITATALSLGVPIISRDARIQSFGIATIW